MKKQLLLILGLMFTATIFAAPVTKETAKKNVLSFLQSKKGNRMYAAAGMKQAQLSEVSYQAAGDAFYVFNIGDNEGFVITSADDRVESILGYSNEGSFNPESLPINMVNWLDYYAKQINAVKKLNMPIENQLFSDGNKKPYRHSIPVMLTTKWNQTTPYNDMCPDYKDGNGHRYTGCVATAMAQVMNFHKWPQGETATIPEYQFVDEVNAGGNGATRIRPELEPTTFNWDLMLDEYNYTSTKESQEEVAKLMLYCGQGLKMSYWVYASGAFTFDIPETLRKYFNYDKGVKYLDKDGISTYEWEDMVYEELAAGRPILYSGASDGAGGHQFVCDGYENEYFHFNWGWGGTSDGYFKLTVLNPVQEGVIGGNGMDFSESQQMVIGIQPPVEGTVRPEDHVQIGYLQLTRYFDGNFAKNNVGNVSIPVKAIYAVNTEQDVILTVGFGLYDADNNLIEVCKTQDKQFVTGGYLEDKILTTSVDVNAKALSNGKTNYLRPIVKNSKGEFEIVKNGDKNYFTITDNGDNVKVTTYPLVNVEFSNLKINGPVYTQCLSEISATIENVGEDFDGIVYLTKNGLPDIRFSTNLVIRRGEKLNVSIPFSSYESTKQSFGLSVNGHQNSSEIEVSVIKSATKDAELDIQPATDITSDGNYLDIPVTVVNINDTDKEYTAPIRAILYLRTGNLYKEVASANVPIDLAPSMSVNTNIHIDGLAFNTIYYLGFAYYKSGQEKIYGGTFQNGTPKKVFSRYKTADALSYYDAKGNLDYKIINEGETFEVPANATYVNVPKNISKRTIKPSSNKNCIYRLLPGVSQSMFSGCNIVKNGACSTLNLTDMSDFYSPEPIMTPRVNLTVNVDNNMTTLFMPFVPETVTCDGVELTRANSVEELASKDYALLPIVAEDPSNVYCDFDPTYTSSPAVLIVKKELIGKAIVFSASELTVNLSNNLVRGEYFNINASNTTQAYSEPIYGFGIKEFSKNLHGAKPFSIYLTPVISSDVEKVNIVYPDGILETGIEDVNADMTGKMVDVYTIDGVKVRNTQYGDKMLEGLPSGLYIVNGMKFVK